MFRSTLRRGFSRKARLATLTALTLASLALLPAIADAYVYWTNGAGITGAGIGRADLDGQNPDQSFISTGGDDARDVAVDAGHVYWTNFNEGTIGRADLDGQNPDQSFISGASAPWGVAVDAGHVYWTNWGAGIGRADLDGQNPDQSFISDVGGALGGVGLAVDALKPPNTKIESTKVNRDKRKATFTFSSSQPDSSFRCRLDRKGYKDCESPRTYEDLAKGKHNFTVKARNAQKADDPSPAKVSFKI